MVTYASWYGYIWMQYGGTIISVVEHSVTGAVYCTGVNLMYLFRCLLTISSSWLDTWWKWSNIAQFKRQLYWKITAQEHIHEITMADFNQYMAILTLHLIIFLTAGWPIIIFICIWPLAWHNVSRNHYNLLIPLLWLFTFSIISLRERAATKDERTHYGTVDKS